MLVFHLGRKNEFAVSSVAEFCWRQRGYLVRFQNKPRVINKEARKLVSHQWRIILTHFNTMNGTHVWRKIYIIFKIPASIPVSNISRNIALSEPSQMEKTSIVMEKLFSCFGLIKSKRILYGTYLIKVWHWKVEVCWNK